MKNIKYIFGLIIFVVLTFTSCQYYRTFTLNEHSKESISTISKYKSTILAHDTITNNALRIFNMRLTEDSISGFFVVDTSFQMPKEPIFYHKLSLPDSVLPAQIIHIFYKKSFLTEGEFCFPLTDIESIEIHENSMGHTILISASITIAPIALLVLLGVQSMNNMSFNMSI